MKKTIVPLLFFLVCLALKATQPSLSQLQFAERNVVLLQDKAHLLPLQGLDTLRIACISMGTPAENEFSAMLGKYMKVKMFAVNAQNMDSVASCLPEYNLTVLGIFGNRLTERELAFVAAQRKTRGAIVCSFANPSQWLSTVGKSTALVYAPDAEMASQQMAAQLIFGGIAAQGKLTAKLDSFKKGNRTDHSGHSLQIHFARRCRYRWQETDNKNRFTGE